MANMINCPYCGGGMASDATICPNCGGPTKKSANVGGAQPFFGEAGTSTCTVCNARVGAGDIVCVQCGANLLTGQKAAKEAAPAQQKRDMQGAVKVLKATGLVLLVTLCGAALYLLAVEMLRDPVGVARQSAKSGNFEDAATLLQEHLQSASEDLEAQFLLGQVYWKGEYYDRAWEAFESVARQGGSRDKEAALLALLALERMPENTNRQRQLTLLRSMIQQRYPGDTELMKVVALLQGVEKEYRGQRDTVETLESLGEATPVLPGLAYAMTEDIEAAEKKLLHALESHPDDGSVAAALGFVHKMRDQEAAAMAVLEQVQNTAPEIAALAKMQLGALLMQRGEYGKALPLLTEAKASLSEDSRCVFLHAVCLQQNKLLDEAVAAFERIVSGSGEFSGLAALQMAVIYLEQGNYDQAASFVKRAGEAGITSPRQATVLGRVYALQGDAAKAEQAYRRAISVRGDYPAARLELGLLLVNRGAIDDGLEELEQYLELAALSPVQYRANEIDVLVSQIKQAKQ